MTDQKQNGIISKIFSLISGNLIILRTNLFFNSSSYSKIIMSANTDRTEGENTKYKEQTTTPEQFTKYICRKM